MHLIDKERGNAHSSRRQGAGREEFLKDQGALGGISQRLAEMTRQSRQTRFIISR